MAELDCDQHLSMSTDKELTDNGHEHNSTRIPNNKQKQQ